MSFDKKKTSRDALDNKGRRGATGGLCEEHTSVFHFVRGNCMNIIRIQDV